MDKEPRKATDVLLDLESKVEILLQIVKSQDLNIKLLSNKLNLLMEKLEKQPVPTPKITVEAVNTPHVPMPFSAPLNIQESENKNIPVSSDFNITLENAPQGFRRTSRPETFSGDNTYLKNAQENTIRLPMQLPKTTLGATAEADAEVIVPSTPIQDKKPAPASNKERDSNSSIPIVQRVVDKNGKSVFLAEVEILDLSNNDSVFKTRTNGTGKWMASLPVGNYRVMIRKRESLSKEKIESGQDITVDGTQSPLELQTIIIK